MEVFCKVTTNTNNRQKNPRLLNVNYSKEKKLLQRHKSNAAGGFDTILVEILPLLDDFYYLRSHQGFIHLKQ